MERILVTGAAGFIGFHLSRALLERDYEVSGIDNLNDYYSVRLKEDRLAQLRDYRHFHFHQLDVAERPAVQELFQGLEGCAVIHLAAQAGVRHSLNNPDAYIDSNLLGFANVLEGCRHQAVQHLVYASSSSVYGANQKTPFSVTDPVDHPISLYAATKRANELMAHAYSHLYHVPSTGLRFFTVYGPWGRPDMALFKFTQSILAGSPINVYNNGQMQRDFTYIDDVVEGILRVLQKPPTTATGNNGAPHKIYNLGNHQPVELLDLIELLERSLGKRARKNFLPMQPGDVPVTFADVSDLLQDVGFRPQTPIEAGVQRFVDWYLQYHQTHQP